MACGRSGVRIPPGPSSALSNASRGSLGHSSPDIALPSQGVRAFSNGSGPGVGRGSDGLQIDWDYVERAIYANYSRKWAKWCLTLMRRYYHVLLTSDASELMVLKPRTRLDVMKALGMLARVLGMRDRWKAVREAYGLRWTRERDYFLTILTSQAYSSLITRARRLLASSGHHRGVLEFIALSGLRVGEALEAMDLYRTEAENYLNRELMVLEHFRYPERFVRKTKRAYITVVDDYMLGLLESSRPITYEALRSSIRRRLDRDHCPGIFRKIWATFMRRKGIDPEVIDLLQGRSPKSIFLRHYYRPDVTAIISPVRENLRLLREELGIG